MADVDQQAIDRPGSEAGSVHSVYEACLFALLAVALGWLLRFALVAWVGEGLPPFSTFYPALVVAALLAGGGGGLSAC